MTATFLLIRHASFDGLGQKLVGRAEGFPLNSAGREEATALAARLSQFPVAAIHSSPRVRARQTALAIGEKLGLEVQIETGLDEIDYGEWTGKSFGELDGNPEWRRFNIFRSTERVPGGETMLQVTQRTVDVLERYRKQYQDRSAILVTHADWIRAVLAHYSGICLDLMQRLEISPASVSILRLDSGAPKVLRMNDTGVLQMQ